MKTKQQLALFAAIAIAFLPILILRDFTPSNELRYLSIADEALDGGHIFAFTNHGAPYADKPPLYLWLVMLGKTVLGHHAMWLLGLFSLIPALAVTWIMGRWTAAELPGHGADAQLMLMTCGLFAGMAFTLRMDMLMTLWIVLALKTVYDMALSGPTSRRQWALGAFTFLALFTKGPLGVLIPLAGSAVWLLYERRLRDFFRMWGWRSWTVLAGGSALWFLAVWAEGGSEYLNNLLFHQTVDRAVDAFHHKRPLWYYCTTYWYSLAPWSVLLAAVAGVTAYRRSVPWTSLQRMLWSVSLATFVMLSIISSKLAVYLLPAIPFFVYLGAIRLRACYGAWWAKLAVAVPAAALLASPAVLAVMSRRMPEYGVWGVWAAVVVLSAGAFAAFVLMYGRNRLRAAIRVLAVAVLGALFFGGLAMPQLNPYMGYGSLCRETARLRPPHVYVWGLHRPENMDAYLGQPVDIISSPETITAPGVLLLPTDSLRSLPFSPDVRGASGPYSIVKISYNQL